MTDTILGYLKRTKDEPITQEPFNEVDSLILAQFSYLKFDDLVPEVGEYAEPSTLQDIYDDPRYDSLFADERYRKNNTALFEGMLTSRRFNQIRLHSYVSILEQDHQTQFAAIVIEFENGFTYVAYRGTDENLIGWKEDLNMAMSRPVPGQIMSVKYLEGIKNVLPDKFMVGGHSKGGNLAVYAAMYSDDDLQSRISDIFNHDGPGFRDEVMDDVRYQAIRTRIRMTVPHSSLIGMLLVNMDSYRVVASWKPGFSGILQHDPFSWLVKGYDFVLEDSVSVGSELKDRSINEWVMSLEDEQIERFLDVTYDIMLATGVDDLNTLMNDWKEVIHRISNAMKDMDEETKQAISKILKTLVVIVENNIKDETTDRVNDLKKTIKKIIQEKEKKC